MRIEGNNTNICVNNIKKAEYMKNEKKEINVTWDLPSKLIKEDSHIFKGKKNPTKTTKVTLDQDKAIIDMNVAVEYGIKIMDVVAEVQENVKKTVEAMTGLHVESVNVCVQNIYVPKKEESESN